MKPIYRAQRENRLREMFEDAMFELSRHDYNHPLADELLATLRIIPLGQPNVKR